MRSGSGCIGVLILVIAAVTVPAAGEVADPTRVPSSPQSAPADATSAHRWHTPRRGAREIPRHVTESHPDDWNPLARPAGFAKTFLRDHRVTTDLFVMFFDQYATEVRDGQHNYGTLARRSVGDIERMFLDVGIHTSWATSLAKLRSHQVSGWCCRRATATC